MNSIIDNYLPLVSGSKDRSRDKKNVAHPWTSVWSVVSMILSSVLQSEITFHTDYHGVGHEWICYERFYVRKKRNPWLIRGHPCEALSPWPAVVCFNQRLSFIRIITDCVTDDFCYELFVWKEKTAAHLWTSVWSVVPMIRSLIVCRDDISMRGK